MPQAAVLEKPSGNLRSLTFFKLDLLPHVSIMTLEGAEKNTNHCYYSIFSANASELVGSELV